MEMAADARVMTVEGSEALWSPNCPCTESRCWKIIEVDEVTKVQGENTKKEKKEQRLTRV